MIHYLKFYLTPALAILGILGTFLGGMWMWTGLLIMSIIVVGGDFALGSDPRKIKYSHSRLLNIPLYLALPLLTFYLFVLAWSSGKGSQDFLSLGSIFHHLFNYDVFAARELNQPVHYFGALLSTGFSVAGYGTNSAHELTHRIHDRWAMFTGKWILSMSMNVDFAIEHVWGHHVKVGTIDDASTAREGENVYAFAVRSTIDSFFSAWKIEKKRLSKKNIQKWSIHNKILRGHLMSLCWPVLFYFVGGFFAVLLFLGQAFFAKFILEVVNYLEHYGMLRNPGERVQPHHSWNSNKTMSGIVLFSLNRHSAHHERGMVPFWNLDPYENVPHLPFGYMGMLLVTLVPPLWFYIMDPQVENWKKDYSNEKA